MKNKIIIILIIILSLISVFFLLTNNKEKGELLELDYTSLTEKLNNKDDFVLVITQSTCSHCATYKPKLKTIAEDYNLNIYYINIDLEDKDTQKKFLNDFNLSGATPTTIFINDGKEKSVLNRIEGDVSTKKIIEKFKKMGFIEE